MTECGVCLSLGHALQKSNSGEFQQDLEKGLRTEQREKPKIGKKHASTLTEKKKNAVSWKHQVTSNKGSPRPTAHTRRAVGPQYRHGSRVTLLIIFPSALTA